MIDHRNPHVPSTLKGKHQWMSADVVMLQNIAMHNRLVVSAALCPLPSTHTHMGVARR